MWACECVRGRRCIDVYVHDDDEYAKESSDGVYLKLMHFQKQLLVYRKFKAVRANIPIPTDSLV